MDSVGLSTQEPSVPVALRLKLGSLYSRKQEGVGVGRILVSHLGSHSCGTLVSVCQDACCVYLGWFLHHHHGCQQRESCSSCMKLMEWTSLHIESCREAAGCPLGTLCNDVKKINFKKYMRAEFNFGVMDGLKPDGQHHPGNLESSGVGNKYSEPAADCKAPFHSDRTCIGAGLYGNGDVRQNGNVRAWNDGRVVQNGSYPAQNGNCSAQNGDCVPRNGSFGPHNGNYSTNNGNYAPWNGNFGTQNGSGFVPIRNGLNEDGDRFHQNGNGGKFHQSGHQQSQHAPASRYTNGTRQYHCEPPYSSPATNHTHSTSPPYQNGYDSPATARSSSPSIQNVRSGDIGGGPISGVGDSELSTEQPDMKAFDRNMSICSTMSIREALHQLGSSLTNEQASFAIKCMVASRRNSSTPSESIGSSSIVSCGDDVLSRQGSVDPNGSVYRSYSCSSKQSESMDLNDSRAVSSAELQRSNSSERTPTKIRKRSSQNKLVHMNHVEESDDTSEATPPHHTPVQRSETGDNNTRVLVNGSQKGTVTQNYSCSGEADSLDDSSDERFSSGGFEGNGGSGVCSSDEGHISYPVQRDSSIESGSRDKILLTPGRGSISMANMMQLRNFDLMREYKLSTCNRVLPLNPSSALPSGLSEDDCSPQNGLLARSSSSSSFSPDSSQPNSLERSSTGGEERGSWDIDEHARSVVSSGLNPEHSPSSLLLKESLPSPSNRPSVECDSTPLEPMSWSLKYESSSSCGTILNHPSEPPSPNFSSHNVGSVNDNGRSFDRYDHPYSSENNFECVSSPKLKSNGESSGNFEGMESEYVESRHSDEDVPAAVLDPHIFASFSDSEASASFSSSHAHQQSLSDSDYEPKHRSQRASVEHVQEDFEGICDRIDEIKERHRDDLEVMRNRRKIMTQQLPLLPQAEGVRRAESKPPSEVWDKDGDVPLEEEEEQPPRFYERELDAYKDSLTPVDPEKVAVEEVNHREYLREYLMGQFQCQRVYREGTHWQRGHPLGRGGQATCYSILDKTTRLALALKEELENDKSLDEAYVCLKLAYEFNVSRNIVEYFSAALLPSYRLTPSNRLKPSIVQLFMEIMPTNMQSYLHRNGPLPMTDVHHFAFQLFDAVEFLHNRERIIHCDIKPANLLVDYTAQHLKLADFGAAELLDKRQTLGDRAGSNCGGTLHYNPPEHYSQGSDCSFALDQWQAGCCVMAMCTGRRPWRHLYMDPTHHRTPPTSDTPLSSISFPSLKKHYANMIGRETSGHIIPGFVDSGIKKLLHGCLNPDPSVRLTAMDCRQLLAFSEEMSEDQRTKVLDAIGCPNAVPEVLLTFDPELPRVDVFLGSHYKKVVYRDHTHTLYPGWLGSLPYRPGLTYQDLPFSSAFPVLSHLPHLEVGLWDGSPQEFFVATMATNPNDQSSGPNGRFIHVTNQKQPVDPSKFIVLFQNHHSSIPFQ